MSVKNIHAVLVGAIACAACSAALGATYRVDDTGTYASQAVTSMRWRQLAPGGAGDNAVDGEVNVALRLDLSAWVHRPARIYMTMAPTNGVPVVASWRTQGRLLPGTVRGGSRVLVFDGVVREAFLVEDIVLSLTTDGRLLERAQSLQFSFDIEVSP